MLVCLLALTAASWVSIAPASLPAPTSARAVSQDAAPKKALTADDVAERLKAAEAKVSQAELLLSELGQVEQAQAAVREAGLLLNPLLNNKALAPLIKDLTNRILAITGEPAAGSADGESGEVAAIDVSMGEGAANVLVTDNDIDAQVIKAIQTGRVDFIEQLGSRSVPGIVAYLNGNQDGYYPDIRHDPFVSLLEIEPREADAFVLKRMQQGPLSVLFKLRFARAIESARPFFWPLSWKPQTPGENETDLPNVLSLCDQLVIDPEYQDAVAAALNDASKRGIYLPGMRAAIQGGMASPDGFSNGVSSWIRNNSPRANIRDLLLDGFQAPNRAARNLVHRALLQMPSNAGIYERVLASDARDRAQGMQWLEEREVQGLPQDPGGGINRTQDWLPPLGDGAAAYVDALLRDPDPSVRLNVVKETYQLGRDFEELALPALPKYGLPATTVGVNSFSLPLNTETLMALTTDENHVTRYRLAERASLLPWEQQQPVLAALAMDSHPDVRVGARRGFSDLAWYQHPEDCTEVLRSSLALESDPRILHSLLRLDDTKLWLNLASRSPEGFEALLAWAVDAGDQALLEQVLTANNQPRGVLLDASPQKWAQALITYAEAYVEQTTYHPGTILQLALRAAPEDNEGPAAEAMLTLLDDSPPTSVLAQAVGLHVIPAKGDERIPDAIASWLSTQEGVALASENSMSGSKIGMELMLRFPKSVRTQAGAALLEQTEGDSAILDSAFRALGGLLPISAGITAVVVAGPKYLEGDGYLAGRVADWMGEHPEDSAGPWLDSLVDHPGCGDEALGAIGRLRDPSLLGTIARVIEGPATHPFYSKAADALKGFMSDDSARLLLIAARKTPSEDQRTWCLAQVEKVAALQDAEERWASRGIKRATRETTVSKLMALLGSQDKAVRIEAIRGLATWEAVEAMPELIELLAAPDADVAQAAREALDRLNGR